MRRRRGNAFWPFTLVVDARVFQDDGEEVLEQLVREDLAAPLSGKGIDTCSGQQGEHLGGDGDLDGERAQRPRGKHLGAESQASVGRRWANVSDLV